MALKLGVDLCARSIVNGLRTQQSPLPVRIKDERLQNKGKARSAKRQHPVGKTYGSLSAFGRVNEPCEQKTIS